ncbi:hypothetical protein ASG92_03650 [Arthrobacter sp. Soil736]|uniref:hypothetical protein n=1 Tax=Arthrobacter sp. Soil736 TaxID=1736395 RepID=UPI0006F61D11|nr:hypothetical protein [Arthrobacter sp. Soil736]KRE64006.1 hypothetical protein ASG92_03650 [Arthrobacter sp. Soil736]
MKRTARLVAVGLVVSAAAGCGLLPGAGAEVCVDWVWFETPQAQFDAAELVVIGRSVRRDGESAIYGYAARAHVVEVESVLKGQPGPGPLRIVSMPPTCTGGEPYPDGDPLETTRRVLIYATEQNHHWFTMTPAQGVLPFDRGARLPFNPGP